MLRINSAGSVLCLFLWAVGGTLLPAAEKEPPGKASRKLQAVAEAGNPFAFDLYDQLRSSESGNLFFSPTSISTALAMTYAGAEGETEKQMAKTLHFSLPEAEVHAAFAEWLTTLSAPRQQSYELRMANRLWGQRGYGFLPEYVRITRENYQAELAQVDFISQTEATRQEINNWVAEQTNDKIQDLIPQGAVDDLTRLVLTNAIYFKGKWEHPFDKQATTDAPFTNAGGKRVDVPMMYQKQRFNYAATGDLQLLEMPYQDGDLAMLILLPKQTDGLAALENQLTAENLDKWTANLRRQEIRTYIPRFQLTEQFQLNSILSALGMPLAFQPEKANFSGMNGKRDLFISAALHKAFVDVNEEGTEAAAATGVVVGVTSVPVEPLVFRADHPFIFLIRDHRTGSILFLGRLVNPSG